MLFQELLDQEFGCIPDLIRAHARERPSAAALVQGDRRLDYASLDAQMDRLAATLQRDGLVVGDAVAICAQTSIDHAITFLGALRAGVVVAPLAPSASPSSLASMMVDCGAKHIFCDPDVVAALASERHRITAPCIVFDSQRDDGPVFGDRFEHWLAPAGACPDPVRVAPAGAFNIIYSSGTTGVPKGIVQTHEMRWAHVRRGAASGYGPGTVTLVSTPLYSNTTLVSFFPALTHGGAVVLMRKFDAGKFLAIAERERVTHAMLVPVQYQRILEYPEFSRFDLSSFQMKFCTSAPFSAALKHRILQQWPGGLTEYYGMTEGGGTCILPAHKFPDKLHTVGFPAPGHDIRVIDEHGLEVAPGEAGEVVGASPGAMMKGYHNLPQKTSAAEWRGPGGKRFIRTGDIGRFDQDGFLVLLDRKKDLIISGGFNVYPSDLEAVLFQHPAVAEAAVVGVPSERWGETPVAFVVLRPAATATHGEIAAWVNERLGKTQRLSGVEVLDSLPRSAIGKVLKRQLRDKHCLEST